jgi:hypothetical protein
MAAFGTAALMSFSKGGYTSVALELVALALLGLAYRWNQRGELARASQWMLATLIAGIFGLMAAGEGLYDEGTLAFPAILIFAGMFGSRRMLWVLMAWLQGALVLLFVLHPDRRDPRGGGACGLAAPGDDGGHSGRHRFFRLAADRRPAQHPGAARFREGSAGRIAPAHRRAGAPRHADPAPQPHAGQGPPGTVAAAGPARPAHSGRAVPGPGQLQDP